LLWSRNLLSFCIENAIAICTVFGAFITPEGSGVTMWFIAGRMILLYVIGMLVIEKYLTERQQHEDQKQQVM
jgi:Sec-independent protein secretion pathway component TatC